MAFPCRPTPAALSPAVKSLNYLNNILAKIVGTDAGSVEALMLNPLGHVAECTGDNVFIVKNGVLKTPSTDAGVLDGITRKTVMGLAAEAGITVEETTLAGTFPGILEAFCREVGARPGRAGSRSCSP